MKTFKYLTYFLLLILVLGTLFYMNERIGIWLSQAGVYVIILLVAYFAGWVLGRMGARDKYKPRISELERSEKELRNALLEAQGAKPKDGDKKESKPVHENLF